MLDALDDAIRLTTFHQPMAAMAIFLLPSVLPCALATIFLCIGTPFIPFFQWQSNG